MAITTAQRAPSWIWIKHDGQSCACGRALQPGDSAKYDWQTQSYTACEHCGESPQREPMPVAASGRPAEASEGVGDDLGASGDTGGLLFELEAFARRNARPGADVRAITDKMLAAMMRCVFEAR